MRVKVSAQRVLDTVLDPGSFCAWDVPAIPRSVAPGYAVALADAQARAGTREAVVVGEARLQGRRVAVMAGEFAFLAGSVGVDAARLLIACIRRATEESLPLLASPTSGGTRMQEGVAAFVQMAPIVSALADHRNSGLPYLVWLRTPTYGGVLASWASLGQLTAAEPGAAIGFLGPRVFSTLHGRSFPANVQEAGNLHRHGLLDAVIPLTGLRQAAIRSLDILCAPLVEMPHAVAPEANGVALSGSAWDSVVRSRRKDRPGIRDVLRLAGVALVELSGTSRGEVGRAVLLGIAKIGAVPCVLVAQDRSAHGEAARIGPADLRVARRGIALAQELRLPLVTVVDTPGGALSREAEEGGLAAEIASCLLDLARLRVPTVSVLLGQGSGGAAMALFPAQRIVCARHAWLSPLSPEGSSAIAHRVVAQAPTMAESQRIDGRHLFSDGIVDRIVDERPDAADEPVAFSQRLVAAVEWELIGLLRGSSESLPAHRA